MARRWMFAKPHEPVCRWRQSTPRIVHTHGCAHAAHQLLAGVQAARNHYAGFWGMGCDCFAFLNYDTLGANLTIMKSAKNEREEHEPVLKVNETLSLEEQIAQRAHELWHQRGRQPGGDLDDWLHAEREINEWHKKRLA